MPFRRTLLLPALAVAALAATPATAAACRPTPNARTPVSARLVAPKDKRSARIVVCLRRPGRTRVIRSDSAKILGAPAVDGWRVIWSELTIRGVVRQDQRTLDARRPDEPIARRLLRRFRGVEYPTLPPYLPTLALPRHGLAWVTAGDLYVRRDAHGAARRLAPDVSWVDLADGRTLEWSAGLDGYRAIDLAPPKLRDGCPVRSAFSRVLAVSPAVRVAAGRLHGDDVVRACLKATHDDAIVTVVDTLFTDVSVAAAGHRIAIWTSTVDRYYGGPAVAMVAIYDVLRRRFERRGVQGSGTTQQAFAPSGAFGWIEPTADGDIAHLLGPNGDVVVDSGPAGSLTGPFFDAAGTVFSWWHDGALRQVPV